MHDENAKRIEPLAALYRRDAFLREGMPVLLGGEGALRLVIDRLRVRFVAVRDERAFANVNTPDDYAKISEGLT
jgi:molybdopterin-guanine dinucleotide biosynthesis protein A